MKTKHWVYLVVAALGVGLLGFDLARTKWPGLFASANPPQWWEGTWKADGPEMPQLDLAAHGTGVSGQWVEPFGDGGYLVSLGIANGEVGADALLFTTEPRPSAKADGKARSTPSPLYLLVKRGERNAELFQLREPPAATGQPRLIRPEGHAGRPVVFPHEAEKHHLKLCTLTKADRAKP